MTTVNVTTQKNTVTVTDANGSTVVDTPVTTVVTASTVGPQGPSSAPGFSVDVTGKVNKSVLYYDSAAGKFLADGTWTTDTLVLGGNF
jgi:hypothetical protein